ncbi:hypothetical protein JDV02_005616 [Purpureocillium takamizusanense]|uniref:Uncharacterized protein n=1 Tax=Purpureocillium takamizusanense TaxID=2060973 RepID=A0A9Q8QIV9_9HYPO|nr:uncharacterized protein JDV02_005616 [Purpureocillium takamizusanense]UNI19432.1 hypothetical protein JDV02_005616 [Purpureocillium takamizusanense]
MRCAQLSPPDISRTTIERFPRSNKCRSTRQPTTMSQQQDTSSPFVITTVLGTRTFDLESIQRGGEAAAPASDGELAWPYIPYDYEPPSAAHEDAVRQVAYIGLLLKTHAPLHEQDDPELLSLLLRSLETRRDLTRRVLQYTVVERGLKALSKKCGDVPAAQEFDLAARAQALTRHWYDRDRSDDPNKKDATGDIPYAPLIKTPSTAAIDKPDDDDGTLRLSESAQSDADAIFKAIKMEREHACSYFRLHRPKPMAWHPQTASAWEKVDREAAATGSMYHLPDFIPIYMGFGLQSMDVPFTWRNPDWDEARVEEYAAAKEFKRQFESTTGSYPLRSEDILQSS